MQKRQSIRERFQRLEVELDVEIAATLLQVVADRRRWRRQLSSEVHFIGNPHRTLGEPVVDAASAVIVVTGEPADQRPRASSANAVINW